MIRLALAAVAFLALAPPTAAWAADDPALAKLLAEGADAVLAEADRRHTTWKDQKLTVKMSTDKGRTLELEIFSKGTDRRAIRFVQPADLRDMRIVVKGTDEIYAKIPGTRKARRVAGHSRKQTLAGTQWNLDMGALIRLSVYYTAKITAQTDAHLTLALTRKEGADINYPGLTITIPRDTLTVQAIDYLDEKGEVVTTERRTKLDRSGAHYTYLDVMVTDTKTKAFTHIEVKSIVNDSGLSDRIFKKRWLERGI